MPHQVHRGKPGLETSGQREAGVGESNREWLVSFIQATGSCPSPAGDIVRGAFSDTTKAMNTHPENWTSLHFIDFMLPELL